MRGVWKGSEMILVIIVILFVMTSSSVMGYDTNSNGVKRQVPGGSNPSPPDHDRHHDDHRIGIKRLSPGGPNPIHHHHNIGVNKISKTLLDH
ncbi:unnamed protein product [Cochlearia groenlandica]